MVAARCVERLLVCGDQREHRLLARRELERAGERVLLRLHDPRAPAVDRKLEPRAFGDEVVPSPDDARRLAAPVEARLEPPLEPH